MVTANKLNMHDAISFELLNIYLQQTRIAVYCSFILAIYLAASFYKIAEPENIIVWVIALFSINFYTLYTTFKFNEEMPVYQINLFTQKQNFLHILSGITWGSAFFVLVDSKSLGSGDYRVAVVVAILMAISAASKSASFKGLVGFVIAISGFAFWYFIQHFAEYGWWFFGTVGLISVTLIFGWMMNKSMVSLVENKLMNESYAEQLQALNDKIEQTNEDFVKRNLELQDIQEQLKLLASHDALTGLHNRRYILERIEEKLPEIRRHQLECCFVIMDVDYFKDVNDDYGHEAGDDVLKAIAQILENGVRQGDIVARYGGEEFLIFLPMTDLASAEILVERLRAAIEAFVHQVDHDELTVTASFGVAQHEVHDSADRTIARADKALYKAKVGGRNRIALAPNAD